MAGSELNEIHLELGGHISKDLWAVRFDPKLGAWNTSHCTELERGKQRVPNGSGGVIAHLCAQWTRVELVAESRRVSSIAPTCSGTLRDNFGEDATSIDSSFHQNGTTQYLGSF